ncbi:hypothetical protein [Caminibacter sp.]
MYCFVRDVIPNSREHILKEISPKLEKFLEKYMSDIENLACVYQNDGYIDEYTDFYGIDDNSSIEDKEEYFNRFCEDFKEVQKEIKEKTGAIIEIGYANNLCDSGVFGYFFYVENMYIRNPKVNDKIYEIVETQAIVEQ